MRGTFRLGLIAMAALVAALTPKLRASAIGDTKAAEVMAAAREALGGERTLSSVKGLSLRAEFRRELTSPAGGGTFVIMTGGGPPAGGGLVTGSMAIDVLFPDKFYREETSTSGLSLTRVDGFEGDRPFLDVISNNPGTRIVADRPGDDPQRAQAALRRSHRDLARLLLGLVAGTQPGMPVTYTYAGRAESSDTRADMIDVAGPEDFKARLFVDAATHLPLMLTFGEPEARTVRMTTSRGPHDGPPPSSGSTGPGSGPGTAARPMPPGSSEALSQLSPEQRAEIEKQMQAARATPPRMIEHRMFFADYREVNGVLLPHHLSREADGKTTEEWEVKEYRVNPVIKADRFKVGTK